MNSEKNRRPAERRSIALFVLGLIFLFLLSAFIYGRIIIEGDGISYYALAVSLIQDRDFDLRNQRLEIPNLHLYRDPATRKLASVFSCGFGALYAPFLLTAEKAGELIPSFRAWHPYEQNSRIPFLHSLGIFLGSSLFGFGTILVAFWLLTREFNVSPLISFCISLMVFAGTPLMFYTFTMPSYAHAADAFLTCLSFCLALRKQPAQPRNLRNLMLGFVLALSVMLRNNNIVLIPPMVLGVVYSEWQQGFRRLAITCMQTFLGALPVLAVLIHFNLSQYGKLLATGYRVQTESSFLLPMLFHPYVGILVWTPVTFFAFLGLIVGIAKRRSESVVALSAVLLVWLSVQFQANWWGGCSFGPRFFTHLYIFWMLGLVECYRLAKRPLLLLSAGASLWTFFLFHVFFINAVSPEMRATLQRDKCRRTPATMISIAAKEYEAAEASDETTGVIDFWFAALGKGKYPTIQYIVRHPEPATPSSPESDADTF